MICKNCGSQQEPNVKFCANCGNGMPQEVLPVQEVAQGIAQAIPTPQETAAEATFAPVSTTPPEVEPFTLVKEEGAVPVEHKQESEVPFVAVTTDLSQPVVPQPIEAPVGNGVAEQGVWQAQPVAPQQPPVGTAMPEQGAWQAQQYPPVGYPTQPGDGQAQTLYPQQTVVGTQQPFVPQPEGFQQPMPANLQPPKKKNTAVVILVLVLVVAILAGVGFLATKLLGGRSFGGATAVKDSPFLLYLNENNMELVLNNGSVFPIGDNDSFSEIYFSDNGQTLVLCSNMDTFYVGTKEGLEEITANGFGAKISPNGRYVFYGETVDIDEGNFDLYRYNVETKKKEKIAENLYLDDTDNFFPLMIISENGESYAYPSEFERNDITYSYVAGGKKPVALETNCMIFAISNDGNNIVYFAVDNEHLVYLSNGKETLLSEEYETDMDYDTWIYTNPTVTQVLYKEYYDDSYFFFEKGKDPIDLRMDYVQPIDFPAHRNPTMLSSWINIRESQVVSGITVFADDLRDYFYNGYWSDEVYYIRADGTAKVIGDISDVSVACAVGDSVYFIDSGTVYYYDKTSDSKKATKVGGVNASQVAVTEGGKYIYYVEKSEPYSLYCYTTATKETTTVTDYAYALLSDGNSHIYYVGENGKIFAVQGTGEPKPVAELNVEDAVLRAAVEEGAYSYYNALPEIYYNIFVKDGSFYYITLDGDLGRATNGEQGSIIENNVSTIVGKDIMAMESISYYLGHTNTAVDPTIDPTVDPFGSGDSTIDYDDFVSIGTEQETAWFNFTVNSAEFVESFEGTKPSSGNLFLVVEVTEKNTWGEATPFDDSDYYIDSPEFDEYILSEEFSGNNMRPGYFQLEVDEEKTSLLVFEVPSNLDEMFVTFTEYYASETIGNTFHTKVVKNGVSASGTSGDDDPSSSSSSSSDVMDQEEKTVVIAYAGINEASIQDFVENFPEGYGGYPFKVVTVELTKTSGDLTLEDLVDAIAEKPDYLLILDDSNTVKLPDSLKESIKELGIYVDKTEWLTFALIQDYYLDDFVKSIKE